MSLQFLLAGMPRNPSKLLLIAFLVFPLISQADRSPPKNSKALVIVGQYISDHGEVQFLDNRTFVLVKPSGLVCMKGNVANDVIEFNGKKCNIRIELKELTHVGGVKYNAV